MPSNPPPEGTWARMFYNLYNWQQSVARPSNMVTQQQQTAMANAYNQRGNGINYANAWQNWQQAQYPGSYAAQQPQQVAPPAPGQTPAQVHTLPSEFSMPFDPNPPGVAGNWGWAPYQIAPGTKMSPINAYMQSKFNAIQAGADPSTIPTSGQAGVSSGTKTNGGWDISPEQQKLNAAYQQQQAGRFATRGGASTFWDPESGMYGYQGNKVADRDPYQENVYNEEGKKVGNVGASGLWWRDTKRSSGKNYRWMRQQAEANGTWPELQQQLRDAREKYKKGIGTGRDPYTKHQAKQPGHGTNKGSGQGKTPNNGSGGQPYYSGNALVHWQW